MTFVGIYQFVWPLLRGATPPAALTGDLNVAVAPFSTAGTGSDDEARALSESAHRAISEQMQGVRTGPARELDIQIRGPSGLSAPAGRAQERARSAAELASTLAADVVVYGTLVRHGHTTTLRPEFWINPRKVLHPEDRLPVMAAVTLPDAPAGAQPAGAITVDGSLDENPLARARLRADVASRARSLAIFFVGLALYSDALAGRQRGGVGFAEAGRWFNSAAASGRWSGQSERVLELFLGNVALQQRKLAQAAQHYAHALRSDPRYTRARLGLAETRYHLSAHDCDPRRVDDSGLQAAVRGYRAVTSREATRWSVLRAKAEFGLGRIEVCRAITGQQGQLNVAKRHFGAITAAVERGLITNRAIASEAHGGSGLVYLLNGEERADATQLRQAIEHYNTALRLSRLPERQAAFYAVLGYLHAQLKDSHRARAAYEEAMRLDPAMRDEYAAELREYLAVTPPSR